MVARGWPIKRGWKKCQKKRDYKSFEIQDVYLKNHHSSSYSKYMNANSFYYHNQESTPVCFFPSALIKLYRGAYIYIFMIIQHFPMFYSASVLNLIKNSSFQPH